MKRLLMITAVLMVLSSGSALGNNAEKRVDQAKINFLNCLDEDNISVLESAIFNVMALKKYYPDHNFEAVIKKLSIISQHSEIPSIRLRAFLALNYFKNSEWFGDYQFRSHEDPTLVFDDMARKMHMHNEINFIHGSKTESHYLQAREIYPVKY